MHRLRSSSHLARLVLAWFALTLAAAALSPVVHPKAMQPVCSADGLKLIAVDADGGAAPAGPHTLECALCLPLPLLPQELDTVPADAAATAYAAVPPSADAPRSPAGAPPPARGPPRIS